MSAEGNAAPDVPAPKQASTPFRGAIKESSRSDLVMIAIVLLFYLVVSIILVISWSQHRAGMQMRVAGLGLGSMYLLCIWHGVKVLGAKATVGFFGLAAVASFFAEFMGSNYGWFFGQYDYTDSLGPRLGRVPILVVMVWGVVLYSSYLFVNWLLGTGGAPRGRSWSGRVAWSALVSLAAAMLLGAWDLMADPMAVSGIWPKVVGTDPWWWWEGGSYLPQLEVWRGSGGIPMTNFAGWVAVPFVILFVFQLWHRQPQKVVGRLVNVVPFAIYGYLYYTMLGALLEMSWIDPGLTQAVLIGTFTMGPALALGLVKLARDYLPGLQEAERGGAMGIGNGKGGPDAAGNRL